MVSAWQGGAKPKVVWCSTKLALLAAANTPAISLPPMSCPSIAAIISQCLYQPGFPLGLSLKSFVPVNISVMDKMYKYVIEEVHVRRQL